MAGIIPKHKIKGVDFCGSRSYCYIIRSDLGCYMRSSDFHKGSDLSIHALHPACQHGDHYFADSKSFYIIKGDKCRRVTDLTEDTDSSVFTLHPEFQGGDHYLAGLNLLTGLGKLISNDVFNLIKKHLSDFDFEWFYIMFKEKGIYRRTADLSNDSCSEDGPLYPKGRVGLYYWGDLDHLYFLKPASGWGVEYYKQTIFNKDDCPAISSLHPAVYSVHPDVLNFLPGGLSITSGPAFGKWVNIKTVSNDSSTPVTWQRKITKKVGYNKEKMSEISHNWKIAASFSISAGKLARLISQLQFSLSGEYRGSSVNTEKENWKEETEEEEQLTCELKPHERLYVWQYQLGLGSEPVLFCRDLKITDTPNTPTEVPLPSA